MYNTFTEGLASLLNSGAKVNGMPGVGTKWAGATVHPTMVSVNLPYAPPSDINNEMRAANISMSPYVKANIGDLGVTASQVQDVYNPYYNTTTNKVQANWTPDKMSAFGDLAARAAYSNSKDNYGGEVNRLFGGMRYDLGKGHSISADYMRKDGTYMPSNYNVNATYKYNW